MNELEAKISSLSDEAKYVAMFQFYGQAMAVTHSFSNSFIGPKYDVAIDELLASGLISINGPQDSYCKVYTVNADLGAIVNWYVSQDRNYRDEIGKSLMRRTPDDRDVAKAVKSLDFCIDMIAAYRGDVQGRDQLIDTIERHLKETRLDIVGPVDVPSAA